MEVSRMTTKNESRSTTDGREHEWRLGWKIKAQKLTEIAELDLLHQAQQRLKHLGVKIKRDEDRQQRENIDSGKYPRSLTISQDTLTGETEGIARLGWRLEMLSLGQGILALAWEPLEDPDQYDQRLEFSERLNEAAAQILNDRHIFYYQYHRAVYFGLQDSFISETALDMAENAGSLGEWSDRLWRPEREEREETQSWRQGTASVAWAFAEEQSRQELAWATGPHPNTGQESAWSILEAAYEKHNGRYSRYRE